jgi:hypothetical protein
MGVVTLASAVEGEYTPIQSFGDGCEIPSKDTVTQSPLSTNVGYL